MCIPTSAPKDNSAEIARAAEERRQAAIRQGTARVNDIFGKFDDNYYSGIEKASNDFYMPQLTDQYEDARKNLILTLGSSGILNGSAGAKKLNSLDERFATKRADIANRGVSTAQQYRGDVERNRSDVLAQLNASANPSAAAAAATARAQTLTAPPAFSALGNLFADFLKQGATGLAVEATDRGRGFNTGLFKNRDSQTIVE